MTLNTIPDIEVIEHLDFDAELPCESVFHNAGGAHSGNAEYMQHGKCQHTTGLRCAAYANYCRTTEFVYTCSFCAVIQASHEITYTPINGAT